MLKMSAKTVYTVILLYLCVSSVLSLYQNYSGAYGQNAYNQPKFGHTSYNNTNLPSWQNNPYVTPRPFGGSPVNSTFGWSRNGTNYRPPYNNTNFNNAGYNPYVTPRPFGGSPANSTFGWPRNGTNYRPPYNNTNFNNAGYKPSPHGGSSVNSTFGWSRNGTNNRPAFNNTHFNNGGYNPFTTARPYGGPSQNSTFGSSQNGNNYRPSYNNTNINNGPSRPFPTQRPYGGSATNCTFGWCPSGNNQQPHHNNTSANTGPYRQPYNISSNIYGQQTRNCTGGWCPPQPSNSPQFTRPTQSPFRPFGVPANNIQWYPFGGSTTPTYKPLYPNLNPNNVSYQRPTNNFTRQNGYVRTDGYSQPGNTNTGSFNGQYKPQSNLTALSYPGGPSHSWNGTTPRTVNSTFSNNKPSVYQKYNDLGYDFNKDLIDVPLRCPVGYQQIYNTCQMVFNK